MESGKKRIRRSAEERIAEIDKKIQYHKDIIEKLAARKEALLNPPKRTRRVNKKTLERSLEALVESGVITEEEAKANLEKYMDANQ